MRFGFRITRGLWVSLPWWCAPLILAVLVAEAFVYLCAAAAMLLVMLVTAIFSRHAETARHPPR